MGKEFDFKEFTSWWENYKGNKHVLDKRIEEALEKSRVILLKPEAMIVGGKLYTTK